MSVSRRTTSRRAARRGASARSPPHLEGARLGPVLQFMRYVWALNHALTSTSKRMRARHGVTGPQRLTIRMAGRFPGISAGDLARLLSVHPSTLTGVIDRLVRRGLLLREIDPRDRRRVLLQLSAAGQRIDQLRNGTVEACVQRALRRATPSQIEATETVLRLLIDSLELAFPGAASWPGRR